MKNWKITFITVVFVFIFLNWWGIPRLDSFYASSNEVSSQNENKKKRENKTENKFRRIIEYIFKDSFPCCRPSFLKNPKTNKNLELDMYNSRLKLAFEYQGIQHRQYTAYFHKNYNDFLKQLERDNLKKVVCKLNGIKLVCIPDSLDPTIENVLRLLNRVDEINS